MVIEMKEKLKSGNCKSLLIAVLILLVLGLLWNKYVIYCDEEARKQAVETNCSNREMDLFLFASTDDYASFCVAYGAYRQASQFYADDFDITYRYYELFQELIDSEDFYNSCGELRTEMHEKYMDVFHSSIREMDETEFWSYVETSLNEAYEEWSG